MSEELNNYQGETETNMREIIESTPGSCREMFGRKINTAEEPDEEWMEFIRMAINLETKRRNAKICIGLLPVVNLRTKRFKLPFVEITAHWISSVLYERQLIKQLRRRATFVEEILEQQFQKIAT